MSDKKVNIFFTKEIYETKIDLETNKDVLERIYSDHVSPLDKLPIEFFFVTDSEIKAIVFKSNLESVFINYNSFLLKEYNGNYEVSGITEPIMMDLLSINKWNQMMWDIGYIYDCKLDGWQVGV